MLWNISPEAEHGVIGPLCAPRTFEQPIRFFTSSLSKRPSRRSTTLDVRKRTSRPASSSLSRRMRSPRRATSLREARPSSSAGGVSMKNGSRNAARRLISASKAR